MNKAVLLLTFNRLEYIKEVFEQVKKARPPRLYIASDGPREGVEGEAEVVQAVRDYICGRVDWDCVVKTRFLEKNSGGCAKGVSGAITWFFENEEDGIILEDDCVPSQSFFRYCEELLDKYKDNKKVWHIGGDAVFKNFSSNASYYFGKIEHCWGWATWADRWKSYKLDISDYDRDNLKKFSDKKEVQEYWGGILDRVQKNPGYSWAFPWTFIIVANDGYCINPVKNLVKNIGEYGVHYYGDNKEEILDAEEIGDIIHPAEIAYDYNAIDTIYKTRFKIKDILHIPIFMASDDYYAPFMAVAMYSILENTKSFINFKVMDGGISEESKELISKSLAKFKNYNLEYYDMSKFDLQRFPNVRHYTVNTFSRYFIPLIAPQIKKCLYLDVDIVVRADIKKLFYINLDGCSLAAVPEDFYKLNGEYVKDYVEPSFRNTAKYFNAGIMVLNNEKFVENNFSEKLVYTTLKYYDKLSCVDQDVYNIMFEHDYKSIDYKYNYMPGFYDKYNKLCTGLGDRIEEDAVIFHYTKGKPWRDDKIRRAKDFWRILEKTAFADKVIETYKIVSKENLNKVITCATGGKNE